MKTYKSLSSRAGSNELTTLFHISSMTQMEYELVRAAIWTRSCEDIFKGQRERYTQLLELLPRSTGVFDEEEESCAKQKKAKTEQKA